MSRYAAVTQFRFEPVAEGLDVETVGIAYTTPQPLRERLYNLALVQALRATARFYMTHTSTQGTAKVRLTDGVNHAIDVEVNLTGEPISISQPVDLSVYSGSAGLFWQVDILTAGSAGAVGRMVADLTVETPLFVTAGQC